VFAEVVDRDVHRDAVHPGVKARLQAEAVEVVEGLHEGLLGEIPGLFTIADHAADHGVDARLVPLYEETVRGGVAAKHGLDDRSILCAWVWGGHP
jgi:hypothetical protein